MGLPVVYAKKHKGSNIAGDVYSVPVKSFTHGDTNNVVVTKEFISPDDRILIVDDFLAHGSALTGLIDIVEQVSLTQQSERAEERGLVHCRQRILQVGEAERPRQGTPYLAPYEKPDRSDADPGLLKYLFI